MRLFTALLAASLALAGQGRAQVLPAGEFAPRDGRPGPGKTWKLTDAQGQALAARMNAVAAQTPIVVDYEHQTITAATTGAKAPAAGWIQKVEWLAGQGLFAEIKWTPAAKGYIDAEEYMYFSPVIEYDEETGEVQAVLMGALVNYPGIVGMQAVEAALSAQFSNTTSLLGNNPGHNHLELSQMKTLLASLAALLGVAVFANDEAALAAVTALKTDADAAKARPAVPAALAAELGLQPTADVAAAVAALAGLKTKATAATGGVDSGALAQITALSAQVAALQAQTADRQVAELADGAIAAGKFVPAFREQLVALGKKDLAALSAMVAGAPVIPGLAGQTAATAAAAVATGNAQPNAALSGAEALQVAANMGIKPEAWTAGLKKAA